MYLIVGWPGQDAYFLYLYLTSLGKKVNILTKNLFIDYKKSQTSFELYRPPFLDIFSYDYDAIFFLHAFHSPSSGGLRYFNYYNSIATNTGIVASFIDFMIENRSAIPKDIVYASSRLCLTEHNLSDRYVSQPSEISPYTASKLASELLLKTFANETFCKVTIFYMFNHESPARPPHYMLPKVFKILSGATNNSFKDFRINPSNKVDIGHSREFMACIFSYINLSSQKYFEKVDMATGILCPLNTIFEGMLSVLPSKSDKLYRKLLNLELTPTKDHPKANLQPLEKVLCVQPRLNGFLLGQDLALEYKSFKPLHIISN